MTPNQSELDATMAYIDKLVQDTLVLAHADVAMLPAIRQTTGYKNVRTVIDDLLTELEVRAERPD